MKKIFFPIFALIVFSAFLPLFFTGCSEEKKQTDTIDSAIIKPEKLMQDVDSLNAAQDSASQNVVSATGEVTDCSKSQVTIKTDEGKILSVSFENLRDEEKNYYHSEEGDRITVKYNKDNENNGEVDGAISIEKAE
jgi:hypothetical protein